MKNIKTITVIGKRWFDRINGNTYHSVKVYTDNKLLDSIDFTYGYGDHYIQSATKLLIKHNIISVIQGMDYIPLWKFCNENDIKLLTDVTDVNRKKDL